MEPSAIREHDIDEATPDFAEPVIGRAFVRPVGAIRATEPRHDGAALAPLRKPRVIDMEQLGAEGVFQYYFGPW
jgi:hypothetical protein